MQIINQLNETNQILQKIISQKELPMVIVVPSSDEIDHHRGKVAKFNKIPIFHIKTKLIK